MRLCDKLNLAGSRKFLHPKVYTHEESKAWTTIESGLESICTIHPKKLEVTFRVASDGIIYFSAGTQEEKQTSITLDGLKSVIPRAEYEGLKVDTIQLSDEFFYVFSFCPSNL